MTKKIFTLRCLFLLSLLIPVAPVSAEETYLLKQNAPEGKYEFNTFIRTLATGRYDSGGNFTLQTLTRHITVKEMKDKKPDGSFTLAYRYKTYKTKKVAPSGTTMEYDSEKPEKSDEPWQKIFATVLDTNFEIRFDAERRVVSTSGYDELRKKLDSLGTFEKPYEEERLQWRDHYEQSTIDSYDTFRGVYPIEPVAVGQSWEIPPGTIRTGAGVFSLTGNANLKSVENENAGPAVVVVTVTGTQPEPYQIENERGMFTYVSATWKMTREAEFDFCLADETSSKTTIEMENQVKNVSKVDTVPDFSLNNKSTGVIRVRITPIKE